MSLTLSCPCGAKFEVEETYAGQSVSCPECQRGLRAPAVDRQRVRTSGLALASTVCALVLAFTGIGTLLAILLGMIALAVIARNRDKVAGTGYAIFGIVMGVLFTGLFGFAFVKGELFGIGEALREHQYAGQIERGGPLEVTRPKDGFAITRPSPQWAVAKPEFAFKLGKSRDRLYLVNPQRDAFIDVAAEPLDGSFDNHRDDIVSRFKAVAPKNSLADPEDIHFTQVNLRHNRRLETKDDMEQAEIMVDARTQHGWFTFLVRLVHPKDSSTVYVIQGWVLRRRFAGTEPEIRRCQDSFRLLNP